MLVLTRRIGEEIVMDGNISVRIVSIKGSNVRLGIIAPQTVSVNRKEVHDRSQCSSGEITLDLEDDAVPLLVAGIEDSGR